MAVFYYKSRRMDGTEIRGTAEAADRDDLVYRLRRDGLYVFHIRQLNRLAGVVWKPRISLKNVSVFSSQMSAMLGAGIPAAKALDMCRRSAPDRNFKEALSAVSERVQKGQALSQAMLELGNLFPAFLIYMVETGESSGTLDVIMEKMSAHYEQEVHLRGKIRTALIYPCILAVAAAAAAVFMLMFVLPQFTYMFTDMELPVLTSALMALSDFLRVNGLPVLIGILIAVAMFGWMMSKNSFRLVVHESMLLLPVAGKLIRTIYTSRFASTFAILYGSGVDILSCLDISGRVLGNSYVRLQLQKASVQLRAGDMFSDAIKNIEVFEPMFVSMVMIGEESGSLDQMLADVGTFYEKEANTAIGQLIALVEPLMILIMGGVIGIIVLAIMMPIFRMYGFMI